MSAGRTTSSLDALIPPGITPDPFYAAIEQIAAHEDIRTVLDIGSSSDGGTTEAFVVGLRKRAVPATLYCMERSRMRYLALAARYAGDPFVKCYNVSDGLSGAGITFIKRESGIETFDVVLIDGSALTGLAELAEVYGAKLILLDGVNTLTNQHNLGRLRDDPEYALLAHDPEVRNGYAIFRRRDYAPAAFRTVQAAVGAIRGTSLPAHHQSLFDKVRSLPQDAVILELGAGAGRDTAAMAHACIGTGRRILSTGMPSPGAWKKNLERCRLEQYASAMIDVASVETVDLVVLGGARDEAEGLLQLRTVWPKLKVGGWMAFRDVDRGHAASMTPWRHVAKQTLGHAEYTSTLVCARKTHAGELPEPVPPTGEDPGDPLPVHFFTVVLNGEPFIRHHLAQFKSLPFEWHWHIVEGVAEGRSTDGTTDYLDQLAREHPHHVTVYRKPRGRSWDGQREMVSMPLLCLGREALLWQIDADELWTAEQVITARQLHIEQPTRSAGFFRAWHYVGPQLVISTRHGYGNSSPADCLRTWRFRPGMCWAPRETLMLIERVGADQWRDVGAVNPFTQAETEARGLVFQHFASATEEQARTRESGYPGAVDAWRRLQNAPTYPVVLRDYLPWVRDDAMVDRAEKYVRKALAKLPSIASRTLVAATGARPRILIDSIFFQYYQTGIARVWRTLLQQWAGTAFAEHLLVLDRAGTAPRVPGLRYRLIGAHDYGRIEADRAMLQRVCTEEGADLFISTYYTTPISTPSVFMAHDMIPEVLKFDLRHPTWIDKHHGIRHASAFVCVSENTAKDLLTFFTQIAPQAVTVAHNGVDASFRPAEPAEGQAFRVKHGLTRPYFLFVGSIDGYKNGATVAAAVARMPERSGFDMLCTGSQHESSIAQFRTAAGLPVHTLRLSDEELRLAYGNALALVFPSIYEGFGMPIVEAMACGCPVITSDTGAMLEVAGRAAVLVNPTDANMLAAAMQRMLVPAHRQPLIAAGLERAGTFSWTRMADTVADVLMRTAAYGKRTTS
jgi:hypothetical protein